jgi:hypothetical protein
MRNQRLPKVIKHGSVPSAVASRLGSPHPRVRLEIPERPLLNGAPSRNMSIGPVQSYVVEHETEADAYLRELFKTRENRSMDVVRAHAQRVTKDDRYRTYFVDKAAELLKAY